MAPGRHDPVNVDNLNFSEKPGRLTIDLLKILLWIFSCRYCSPKCFFNHRANIEVIISSFIGAIRLNGTSSPPKTWHSKQNIERRTKWAYRRAHLVFHYFLISSIKTYYTFSRRVAVLIVDFSPTAIVFPWRKHSFISFVPFDVVVWKWRISFSANQESIFYYR